MLFLAAPVLGLAVGFGVFNGIAALTNNLHAAISFAVPASLLTFWFALELGRIADK